MTNNPAFNCNSTYRKDPYSYRWQCQLPQGHTGAHIKTFLDKETIQWPNLRATLYQKSGRGHGKTATAHQLYPGFSVGGYEPDGTVPNWSAKVDEEFDHIKGETPVLLTKEELKVIAYYLQSADDEDETDLSAITKIDAALKKLL